MLYRDFKGKKLSLLGFGAMRLPQSKDGTNGGVDVAQVEEMIGAAFENGINYFDTAYPYHKGESERIMGRILSQYPRDQYYLATKYPGHQVSDCYNPAAVFEEQLEKCRVDHFDFYLLHNVCERSLPTYRDERWKIVEYFTEQRKKGRITHLGFSSHAALEGLEEILDLFGNEMEFCQIQINYLDWSLQKAAEKYELLTRRNISVWGMEPVRGGKLANLPAEMANALQARRPEESAAAWGFRFLQGLPGMTVILSGMSNLSQLLDNVKTFSEEKPLTTEEQQLLFHIADTLKNALPCTGCNYCRDGCPKQLDIPYLISQYNEFKFQPGMNIGMRMDALPEEKRPGACIACGRCSAVCPQKIEIPEAMAAFAKGLAEQPSWDEICRQREEDNRRSQMNRK